MKLRENTGPVRKHGSLHRLGRMVGGGLAAAALVSAMSACEDKTDGVPAIVFPLVQNTEELGSLTSNACRPWYDGNIFSSRPSVELRQVKRNNSRFPWWKRRGVGRGDRGDTYIAEASKPCKQNVRHLAIFIAGQQGAMGGGNGHSNGLTGQPDKWRKKCRKTKCRRSIDRRSLFVRVLKTYRMPVRETYYALVFNSDFNFEASVKDKREKENAFYDWITAQADYYRLKTIYLAGSSRGGALTSRLAKRLKNDYRFRNIPLILQNIDGTYKPGKEMGVPGNYHVRDNPVSRKSDYRGMVANLHHQFRYRNKLAIYQIVGGESFKKFVSGNKVRGYTYAARECDRSTCDLGWYRQRWEDLGHESLGRDTYRYHFTTAVNFFTSKFDHFRRGGSSPTGIGTCR